jgi:hypothetical protein
MNDVVLVAHCAIENFDAVTQTCTAVFWSVSPSFPPPMSIADALKISGAIGACWGIGHMIRQSRRAAASG